MKSILSATLLVISAMAISLFTYGQSPVFTQSFLNPSYSMPTMVGWHGGLGIQSQYRNQWPGIPASFVTSSTSVDGYVHKLRSGFGMDYQHDRAGDGVIITNMVNLHWSPKIKLGEETYLSPVATFTYLQQSIDWDKLTFGDQIDQRFGFIYNTPATPIESSVNKVAFGTGLAFVRNGFTASAYCGYLNQPNMSFFENAESRLPKHWRLNVAQRFMLSEAFSLTPTLMYARQGQFNMLNINMNMQYKGLFFGTGYRWNDAVMFAAGYEIKEAVMLTYSYDMTVSRLGTQTLGSHEVGVRAILFRKRAKQILASDLPLL